MLRFNILDIDNCIADDSWRIPHINWHSTDPIRRYHDYHTLSPWDTLHNRDLLNKPGVKYAFFTGRPVFYRKLTEQWLQRNGVEYAFLLMRNDRDERSSVHLKQWQLESLIDSYGVLLSSIELAIDDLPGVVAMYRTYGLNAEVRQIHNVSSYRDPITGLDRATGKRWK